MSALVIVPLLNPNEPEAMLAALHVSEGQQIDKGDVLCTLETTKSAADITAESTGFVVGLAFSQGQTVRAGDLLCYLAESPEWTIPSLKSTIPGLESQRATPDEISPGGAPQIPEGLRITQLALSLARQYSLDLTNFPAGQLITEAVVRARLEKQAGGVDFSVPTAKFDPTSILVYGGGGHGKMLVDLLRGLKTFRIIRIVDDGLTAGETVMGIPVLGGGEVLPELHAQGVRLAVNGVGGIGDIGVRIKVFQKLAEAGFAFPAVVHPTATKETSAVLSPGAQVFAHAYVGSEARVGFGSIVNTGVIVSHDCLLGDYSNLSPGAILAGEVQVGSGALVGMGATVNLRVKIGAGARIGNGATVKSDVPEKGVVRAGTIWPG